MGVYQRIDGVKRIIKMWSKAWKTEAWKKKPTYIPPRSQSVDERFNINNSLCPVQQASRGMLDGSHPADMDQTYLGQRTS